MRRYVVRFLVAVLTFGIGVALSLALGLFKFQDTRSVQRNWSRKDCPKRFRVARPAFLTVDSRATDPLKLVYLGTSEDESRGDGVRMRFSVANNSDKTITGYWITAREIWDTNGKPASLSSRGLDWTAFEVLEPGDASTISLPRNAEGSSLRVARVNFQDGSTWTSPRVYQ
jgi:hypothetical protein